MSPSVFSFLPWPLSTAVMLRSVDTGLQYSLKCLLLKTLIDWLQHANGGRKNWPGEVNIVLLMSYRELLIFSGQGLFKCIRKREKCIYIGRCTYTNLHEDHDCLLSLFARVCVCMCVCVYKRIHLIKPFPIMEAAFAGGM